MSVYHVLVFSVSLSLPSSLSQIYLLLLPRSSTHSDCVDSTVDAKKFNYDLSFLACGVQVFGEHLNLLFDCLSSNELIFVSLLCHMLKSELVKEQFPSLGF